jgi:hypothetical protein
MGQTVLLGAYQKQLFAMLPPDERYFAETLLRAAPNYRYELSGLPKLNPSPAPGPASAAAAAKALLGWMKSRRDG